MENGLGGLNYDTTIMQWTPEQWQNFGKLGGTIDSNNNLGFGNNITQPGMFDWLFSDTMKSIGTIGGLATSGLGALNQRKAQKHVKRLGEAENDRANKIMAMNTEKYNQYKADKSSLQAAYMA